MDYELIEPDAQDKYDPAPFFNYARARRTDKQDRDPDVGDAVHFWDMVDARCLAAIVGVVHETFGLSPGYDLMTLAPTPEGRLAWDPRLSVVHDETKTGPGWHWPCGEGQ